MKTCGVVLCVLAALSLSILYAINIINYSWQIESAQKAYKELAEAWEDHAKQPYHYYMNNSCSTCKEYRTQESELRHNNIVHLMAFLQSMALHTILGGMLFALGIITCKINSKKRSFNCDNAQQSDHYLY